MNMGRPPLKRGAIERSALELFVEKGVDGTSIRDIAQRAGVTEGALYRHHRSKHDLVRHLFVASDKEFAAAKEALLSGDGSSTDRLTAFVTALFELYEKDAYVFRYVVEVDHHLLREVRVGEADLRGLLARAIGRDGLAPLLILGMITEVARAAATGRLAGKLSSHTASVAAAVVAVSAKA
jgi:AcrR family transcriptional regulator